MHRSFQTLGAAVAATLLLSGAASAAERTVSLVGKDDATIRSDIRAAAKSACKEAYAGDQLGLVYELDSCIDAATADALAKVAKIRLAASGAVGQLARNGASARGK